ncbi:MAG TPA: LacI family DNA-binding transcriptional regulator [Trueperaceae bacterium]
MAKRSATILDVANAAGVSTATVSRVLNGGRASEAARAAVERAVAELNYRRNDLARGLVTGRTGVIGVLIPDVIGPLYAQMARGIEDVLEPLGMHYMMVTDNRSLEQEAAALELLLARQVDALVLIGSQLEPRRLEALLRGGPATVLVQRELPTDADDFTTLAIDNRAGVAASVDHLVALGHTRIAHIAGIRRDGVERRQSFIELVGDRGLQPAALVESDSREESGREAAQRIFGTVSATAVVCTNDRVAVGVYRAARERGLSIPADLAVVGFDDLPWSAYLDPPLTTVRQPARTMGREAARRVLAALAGEDEVQRIVVAPRLIERESSRGLARSQGGETNPSVRVR